MEIGDSFFLSFSGSTCACVLQSTNNQREKESRKLESQVTKSIECITSVFVSANYGVEHFFDSNTHWNWERI